MPQRFFALLALLLAVCPLGAQPASPTKLGPLLALELRRAAAGLGKTDAPLAVVIYTDAPAALERAGVRVGARFPGFVTADVPGGDLARIAALPGVRHLEGGTLAPANDEAAAFSGITAVRTSLLGGRTHTGAGTLVCVIDTGLDWRHLDFRDPADTTISRVVRIWDQTLTAGAGEAPPTGFSTGVEYTKAQIEDELDGSPAGVVRSADVSGHGTHVTGTVVGNGAAVGRYTGMAPEAGIVVVKTTFATAKIVEGIAYCGDVAQAEGKPVGVNMSLATDAGPHDGTDPLNAAATAFGQTAGRVAVLAAGNSGAVPFHRAGTVPAAGSAALTVNVCTAVGACSYSAQSGASNDYFALDLWFDAAPDATVTVTSPNGQVVSLAPGAVGEETTVETPDGAVYLYNGFGYGEAGFSTPSPDRHVTVFVYDAVGATRPATGTWTITLAQPAGSAAGFDAWLYAKTIPATLVGGDTEQTVANAATGAVIAGAWAHRWAWCSQSAGCTSYGTPDGSDAVASFSGRGPSRDGRTLPTVVAPGRGVISSRSRNSGIGGTSLAPGGQHYVGSGTSHSTPVVTGAVALLLEQSPSLTAAQVLSLLTSTAAHDAFTGAGANDDYGAGKLDAYAAMARLVDGASTAAQAIVQYEGAADADVAVPSGGAASVRVTSPLATTALVRGVLFHTTASSTGTPVRLDVRADDGAGLPGALLGTLTQPAAAYRAGTWNYVDLTGLGVATPAGGTFHLVVAPTAGTLGLRADASATTGRSHLDPGTGYAALGRDLLVRAVLTDALAVPTAHAATSVTGDAGWRLLAMPATATTVGALARQNLVQGVTHAYPQGAPNLFTAYDGTAWVVSSDTTDVLVPGQGFAWYFFDQTITPGDVSRSVPLPFTLRAPAAPPLTDQAVTLHANGDGWNLLGNPFAGALRVDELSRWAGAEHLASVVGQVWEDAAGTGTGGSYVPTTLLGDAVAAFSGYFVQAQSAGALTVPASAQDPAFVLSKAGQAAPRALLAFELSGTTTSGLSTRDRAAVLVFSDDARDGWDALDAAKLEPLASRYALAGFVGEDAAGGAVLKAQEARPLTAPARLSLPLDVQALGVAPGLTLRWPRIEGLPAAWRLVLEDRLTGATRDLRRDSLYRFDLAASAIGKGGDEAALAPAAPAPAHSLRPMAEAGAVPRFVLHVERGASTGAPEEAGGGALVLLAPVPNPARGLVRLAFALPAAGDARLEVYDALGRRVAVPFAGAASATVTRVPFDTSRLAAGVYLLRLTAAGRVRTARFVVLP